jgi:spore germination protein YaaH
MVARNRGRYLAPIALVAVIVATVLVIRAGLGTTHHGASLQNANRLPVTRRGTTNKRFYVVQAGDSLTAISVKTGVSVTTLESLNPSADPNALQTGQRLRLRP